MKQILMIIAPENFRDEEVFHPKQVLERENHKVTIASKGTSKAIGVLGGEIEVNLDIAEANTNDYDAIIFTGGPGAKIYFEDQTAHQIARQAIEKNKILAAICVAPRILANAGVLKGKKATVWNGDNKQGEILKEKGVIFTNEDVTIDNNIITANGPQAATKFGEEIAKKLNSK